MISQIYFYCNVNKCYAEVELCMENNVSSTCATHVNTHQRRSNSND